MHKLTEVTLGGKLNLAPIPKDAKRILDIGTGTGIWAIEMGKLYVLRPRVCPVQNSPSLTNCKTLGDKFPDAEVRPLPKPNGHVLSICIDQCRLLATILARSNPIGMSQMSPG